MRWCWRSPPHGAGRATVPDVDYSRFYLVGTPLTGYGLYCSDCDEDDRVPWEDPSGALDLGEMVRVANRHAAEKHPAELAWGEEKRHG